MARTVTEKRDVVGPLAAKLRMARAKRAATRIRSVRAVASRPLNYIVKPQRGTQQDEIRALLVPLNRITLLEQIISSLDAHICRSLKYAQCGDELLLFSPDGTLPDVRGAQSLRAIDNILLPRDLGFQPRLEEHELAALFPASNNALVLLQIDCGRITVSEIDESAWQPLDQLISAPFADAQVAPLNESAAEFYGARLMTIIEPPPPALSQVIDIEMVSADAQATAPPRKKGSLWQRLKEGLLGNKDKREIERIDQLRSVIVKSGKNRQQSARRRLSSWLSRLFNRPTDSASTLTIPPHHKKSRLERYLDRLMAKATLRALMDVPGLARMVMTRHSEYMMRLTELMNQGKWEEAFRHALPLESDSEESEEEARIGLNAPAPRANIDFNLGELFARARGSSVLPIGLDGFSQLKYQYEQGARTLLEQKNYRGAAYVYARLLKDYKRAAQALSSGGYHREASVVYLQKLNDPLAAAIELATAGDYEQAALIALDSGNYERAAQFRRTAGNEAGARECFHIWVEQLLKTGNREKAAQVLEKELGDWRRAVDLWLEVYRGKTGQGRIKAGFQAAHCLTRANARDQLLALMVEIRADLSDAYNIGIHGTVPYFGVLLSFAQESMQLEREVLNVGLEPLNIAREARRCCAEAVSGFAAAGLGTQTRTALNFLREFGQQYQDALLIGDINAVAVQYQAPPALPAVITDNDVPRAGAITASTLICIGKDLVLIGRGDGCIECRRTLPKPQRWTVGQYRYSALAVAAESGGARIAMLSVDGVVTVWSAKGDLLIDFRDPAAPFTAIYPMIRDGKIILGDARGRITVFDVESGQTVATASQEGMINAIDIDIHNKILACAGQRGLIMLYNYAEVADNKLDALRNISAEKGSVRALAFRSNSKNSPLLAFGGEHGELAIVNWVHADLKGPINRVNLPGQLHWINTLCFAPDGRLVSAGFDKKIYIWDYRTGRPVILAGHKNEIIGLAFDSHGQLYSADSRGVIACWDIATEQLANSFELEA